MIRSKALIALALVGVCFLPNGPAVLAGSAADIPIPDCEIVPLPPDAPPGLGKLLGEWRGSWQISNLDSTLVVKEILPDQKKAKYLYGWGVCPAYNIMEPGCSEGEAELVLGKKPQIEFVSESGARFRFVLKGDKLKGTRKSKGYVARITMEKAKD